MHLRIPQTFSSCSPAHPLKETQFREGDIIIALIGTIGSGKTNFVEVLARSYEQTHPQSGKHEIGFTRIHGHATHADRLVLLDTPGYEYTGGGRTSLHVLEMINKCLKQHSGNTLSGAICFMDIQKAPPNDADPLSIGKLRERCSETEKETLSRVMLLTTFWDRVKTDADGQKFERKLNNARHWKAFVAAGAPQRRFNNTEESAWDAINRLLRFTPESPVSPARESPISQNTPHGTHGGHL